MIKFSTRSKQVLLITAAALVVAACGGSSGSSSSESTAAVLVKNGWLNTSIPAITAPTVQTYALGSTGPGGGTVFYVASSYFTSTGSACGTTCKYLEAAPSGWNTSAVQVFQASCAIAATSSSDPSCAWSANTKNQIGSTAKGTKIGTGYANTSAMIEQNSSFGKAATVSRAFQGGGKTDWFLPSKDELNQLFIQKALITGLSGYYWFAYWSSSEDNSVGSWNQHFGTGVQSGLSKAQLISVRPVRAF